jgi:hypothetical protein
MRCRPIDREDVMTTATVDSHEPRTLLATAALTNTATMGIALARLPYNRTAPSDGQTVVSQLVSPGCAAGRAR